VRDAGINLLKDTLRLILAWMPFDEMVLLKLILDIFDEDAKFYIARRLSGEYSSNYMSYGGHAYGVCRFKIYFEISNSNSY
jgi:hypothetical protein